MKKHNPRRAKLLAKEARAMVRRGLAKAKADSPKKK